MSLSEKIKNIKRKRHDGQYAWGHADALIEAVALAKEADETITALLSACKAAVVELNEIRARDGVPYTHYGIKASVCEEYFSNVVDGLFAAIAKAEGT